MNAGVEDVNYNLILMFDLDSLPVLAKNFCAIGKILKKQSKKGVFGTFWKILTKKIVFFGARPPQN